MKKVYALTLLLILNAIAGFSQNTRVFYAGGGSAFGGTNITGSSKYTLPPPPPATYSRNDNVIALSNNGVNRQSGYAVFNIAGLIPSGSTISSVKFGMRIIGVTTPGSSVGTPTVSIYGKVDNYAVTTGSYAPGATFHGYLNGTTATLMTNSVVLGTSPGEYALLQSGPTQPLVQLVNSVVGLPAASQKISLSITMPTTTSGIWEYNFGGELYDSIMSGLHCPFLEITYCYSPTILSASIAPTPICAGQTFTLSGLADGASIYRWRGPNGFNQTGGTVTATATSLSVGTYSLTAYTSCGTFNDSVVYGGPPTTLAVNPSPAALVTTTTTVCVGNTIYMSDITGGGTWITSNPGQATVTGTGAVTALASGFPVISYRLGTCLASATVTVNDPPDPITGPTEVCASGGQITLLNNITAGGVWTSTNSSLATIDPSSGVVTGVTAGSLNISYMTGGCPSVGYPITVNPLPNPITGTNVVCVAANVSLSTTTGGGTWSSSSTALADVNPSTGVVTGVGAGSPVYISYTLPTGCYVTYSLTVNPQPNVVIGTSALCSGQCSNLSDATPSGTWTSSNTMVATVDLNNGAVCALAGVVTSTVANITYTSPTNGCYILHALTVNPLPSAIIAPIQVCAESAFSLSDVDAGGTWSSSNTSMATIDANTGDAQAGTTAGSVRFTYTFTATGCSNSTSVTILPLPTSTITADGPLTFCAGDDVTLTGPTGAGYTYQWYSNGSAISGEMAITYTTAITELVNLRVTDGNGCSKMSADAQITLIPAVAVAAGGPVVFCQPNGVTLSVPLAPGILYQWKLNGTNIPGAVAHTYNAVANGIYTADLVVPGGCFSTTPPFTVTVHDMPHPPISFNGSTINTINGYFNYQWFLNTIAIPGATGTSVTPTVNGQYIVRVVDGNGCVGYSPVYILNLGVDQVGSTGISIYPNPATSVVNISTPIEMKAVVTSVDGRTLLEQENATQVDISKLPNGLYMIMLYNRNGDRLFVQKLTKE